MDFLDVLAILWMFFNWIILAPIIIYYLYRFNAIDKRELVMQFRNKPIVNILNAIMLITLLGERLYSNAVAVWLLLPLNAIYYFVFSVAWWSGFFFFLVKVFDLYYKQQYSMHIADMVWITAINPDEKTKNWFIANKRTYGDPIYCAKILAVPFVVCVCINTIVSIACGEGLALDFTQFGIASIPIVISFVIFYKSRKLDDVHKIRNETLYQCIILMIAVSFYLFVFLIFKILVNTIDSNTATRIEWLLRNLVANLCAVGLALVPTAYPVVVYQSTHLENKIKINLSQSDLTQAQLAHQNETVMSITQVMSRYKSFKAFMEHLILEFNTEAMLFLVELIQIKHDYFDQKTPQLSTKRSKESIDLDRKMLVEFKLQNKRLKKQISSVFNGAHGRNLTAMNLPTKVPKSGILDTQTSLRPQMIALYDKYIKVGSDHELNLSGIRRVKLRELFESDDVQNGTENEIELNKQLINSMDEAAMEILMLLQDPFQRFRERNDVNMELSESSGTSIKTPITP